MVKPGVEMFNLGLTLGVIGLEEAQDRCNRADGCERVRDPGLRNLRRGPGPEFLRC